MSIIDKSPSVVRMLIPHTVTERCVNVGASVHASVGQTGPEEPGRSQRSEVVSSCGPSGGRESAEETVSMELCLHRQEGFFSFSSFSHLSATDCPEEEEEEDEEEEEEEEEVTTVLYTEAFLPNYV
ncbi:hypothetical protein EYF80_053963 [Liparis tanakae]|uniref:Uncharacterized protein n=1 Tax=Liparis tanakae TaxID=230148 RepID=A0A4Z2F4N5_9TELE|nr:hypothetical protein EYF80_053963 [Liparis tanakae]